MEALTMVCILLMCMQLCVQFTLDAAVALTAMQLECFSLLIAAGPVKFQLYFAGPMEL